MKVVLVTLIGSFMISNVLSLPLGLMWGLSLGMAPFGLLGLGGLGLFGPLGFGLGLRRGLFFRGKRDLTQAEIESSTQNVTLCAYTNENTMLTCAGAVHNFACNVTERLTGLERLEVRLADLEMVPVEEKGVEVVKIFSRASSGLFTMIKPKTRDELVLSFFNSDKFQGPGFWIKDEKCWTQFETMMKHTDRNDVTLALLLDD